MSTELSPMEKWQREKAKLASGESQEETSVNSVVSNNSSVYKKPGEYCPHPENMSAVMKGYKVCLACGKTLEEGVAKSAEEKEEETLVE